MKRYELFHPDYITITMISQPNKKFKCFFFKFISRNMKKMLNFKNNYHYSSLQTTDLQAV